MVYCTIVTNGQTWKLQFKDQRTYKLFEQSALANVEKMIKARGKLAFGAGSYRDILIRPSSVDIIWQ
jgi:hypothetical protein